MTQEAQLKACPFCGMAVMPMRDGNHGIWAVTCNNDGTAGSDIVSCGMIGPERATEAEAIAAWNTRIESGVVAELKEYVVAFGGPWAVQYSRDFGLPDGHLHPTHYDILEKCGARMNDFTRAKLEASK